MQGHEAHKVLPLQCYIVCLPNSFRERFDSLRKAITAGAVNAAEGVDTTTHRMNTIVQVVYRVSF